jgi:hypothetical protein
MGLVSELVACCVVVVAPVADEGMRHDPAGKAYLGLSAVSRRHRLL